MLAEGQDRYYVASGLEFTAYTNLEKAKKDKETADKGLEEVKEVKSALQKEYKNAEFEVGRATNNEEWNIAFERFAEVETRWNALLEKERIAKEASDQLKTDIPNL